MWKLVKVVVRSLVSGQQVSGTCQCGRREAVNVWQEVLRNTTHGGVCVSSREIINDVFTLINLWCSVTLRHSHFLCPIWRPSHSIVNVVCWITIRTTEPLNCCFCCIFLGRQSFSAVNYWHTNVFRHGKLFPPFFFFSVALIRKTLSTTEKNNKPITKQSPWTWMSDWVNVLLNCGELTNKSGDENTICRFFNFTHDGPASLQWIPIIKSLCVVNSDHSSSLDLPHICHLHNSSHSRPQSSPLRTPRPRCWFMLMCQSAC